MIFATMFQIRATIKAAEDQQRYHEAIVRRNEEMARRSMEERRWAERTIEVEFRRLS